MININIAKDFTDTPGGRFISQGEYSGEEFRNEILKPKFLEAINSNQEITINFDDVYGYAPSFLEEAFGGLVRQLEKKECENIEKILHLISNDDPTVIDKVKESISDALKEKK